MNARGAPRGLSAPLGLGDLGQTGHLAHDHPDERLTCGVDAGEDMGNVFGAALQPSHRQATVGHRPPRQGGGVGCQRQQAGWCGFAHGVTLGSS